MSTQNIFLTKGATIEAMTKAMPKATVESGFQIINNHIEYIGNPAVFKYVIPRMVTVVESLPASAGFKVVRTPKTYTDKNGNIKTTDIVTVDFKDAATAQILVDNVNKLVKAEYEEWKATHPAKKSKKK